MRAGQAIRVRACAASWWVRVLLRKTRTCGLLGSVLSVTWRERQRTSSAELERSAAISLGMQLDSSPLVLVAEVSSLLALRPRPIVRDVCGRCVRREGEGEEIRSAAKGRRSDEGAGQGRWSWALGHRHLFVDHLGVGLTFCVKLLFVGSRPLARPVAAASG